MFTKRVFFIFLLVLSASRARCDDVIINEIMYHPASENPLEEYIELFNSGTNVVDLTGWRFKSGVNFTLTNVSLAVRGYLVVAANVAAFRAKYPLVANVVGGWVGTLANTDEDIELDDAFGQSADSVHYASGGDWAVRTRGPMDHNHQGWTWFAAHDGGGKSLELINPLLPNRHGQNWAASLTTEGTPGRVNSVLRANIAPFILQVSHFPTMPKSSEPVAVTARLLDERTNGVTAALRFRIDGAGSFSTIAMYDDGIHRDGPAGDGFYGALLPAHTNNSVVEFYVEARDLEGNVRTWPGPVQPAGVQSANLLFQVRDSIYSGQQPLYLLIMTEVERAELDYLGDTLPDALSDAEMNGTFISVDELGVDVHYAIGIRNRGHGGRTARPNNYHVKFPNDRRWKGVQSIELNTQFTHAQLAGNVLFYRAGIPAPLATAVQVRVNNANLAMAASPQFGSYVAIESLDSDFADNHFPDDSAGNIYAGKAADGLSTAEADLYYRGTNSTSYTNVYFKATNKSVNDWTDLIGLTRVLTETAADLYRSEVARVVDINEWLRYFAINALLDNNETGIYMGYGDDYSMYRGVKDPRFLLLPHDLDTIMGEGSGPGTTNAGIFRGADLIVIERFLKSPEFLPLYYAHLRGMIETMFSEAQMNPMLEELLGSFVPLASINRMQRFNASRVAYVRSILPTLLPVTNTWRYNQSGADLGTAWREVAYSDTAWPAGQGLLYNESATLPGPKRTQLALGPTTYYFRTHFHLQSTFTNVAAGLKIRVSALIDDGAVFYLNGVELLRLAMPDGAIDFSTLATRAVGDATWEGSFSFSQSSLVAGDNVLAVEVHQTDPTSTDVVFGMTLDMAIEPISTVPSLVIINEVMANNISRMDENGNPTDWVELYNRSPNAVDLSDTSLSDNIDLPRKWAFPAYSIIPPHGFLAIRCDSDRPSAPGNTGFSLKKTGDQVFFFDNPINGERLLDSISFGLQAADFSIGRVPNGAATWLLNVPTDGGANVSAQLASPIGLKVNEWMAGPITGSDWFEVCNPQANPVELSGLVLSDNPSDRTQSRVPALSFIAGGAQGFQKFDADGTSPSKGANHANFKLSTSGETIALFAAFGGAVIDSVTFGAQQAGVSQGRYPDGSTAIQFFGGSETPGKANSLAQRPQIVRSGENVLIRFYGGSGNSYTVQYRNSLSAGGWLKLESVFPVANGPVELVDVIVPNNRARFYRIVTPATL
jgi:hypothetical protein